MTEKKEPQYIGRYGEVLKRVKRQHNPAYEKVEQRTWIMEGIGLDEFGNKRKVIFEVSRKTNKKLGFYSILRPNREQSDPKARSVMGCHLRPHLIEQCHYSNDSLHGYDTFYDAHGNITKRVIFVRGKQVENDQLSYSPTRIVTQSIGKGRKRTVFSKEKN